MRFTGPVLITDRIDRNGRFYPKKLVEDAILEYQKKIEAKRSLGCIGVADSTTIDLSKVSHIVENISMVENSVIATVKTLQTPEGIKAVGLLASCKFDLKPRGTGMIYKDGKVSNFELISIDILPKNP